MESIEYDTEPLTTAFGYVKKNIKVWHRTNIPTVAQQCDILLRGRVKNDKEKVGDKE